MPEDPRDLIRAAQAAELAKDFSGAVGLLERAAAIYRAQGSVGRAEQLERNIERLTQAASARKAEGSSGEVSERAGLFGDPVDEGGRRRPKPEVKRGTELADPSQIAWCSFCCRPSSEVGRLVTGPTGSFICQGCVFEARAKLTGPEKGTRSHEEFARAQTRETRDATAGLGHRVDPADVPEVALLPSQREALEQIERGLKAGAERILLLGPVGAGKTRLLISLAKRGLGAELSAGGSHPRMLMDEDLLSGVDGDRRAAELSARPFVLAAVGALLYPRFHLTGPERFVLPSTAELAEATSGRLPLSLLEAVDWVVPLRSPSDLELRTLAARMLSERSSHREISDRLLSALVVAAVDSGRGLHELMALVRRVPPGTWELGEEER